MAVWLHSGEVSMREIGKTLSGGFRQRERERGPTTRSGGFRRLFARGSKGKRERERERERETCERMVEVRE